MKKLTLLSSLCMFIVFSSLQLSCKDDPSATDSGKNKQADTDTTVRTIIGSNTEGTTPETDHQPLIDNIPVTFQDDSFRADDQIQGKDANYYNVDVEKGQKYTAELSATDSFTNMMIFSPKGSVLYDKSTMGNAIRWTGSFDNYGKATFHISLDAGKAQKNRVSSIELSIDK